MSHPWEPENPYPASVFTMTIDGYVKAVPDEALRTAISGCLMRKGFALGARDGAKKLWEWLNEPCMEHEHISDSYGRSYYLLHSDCHECHEKIRKEIGA